MSSARVLGICGLIAATLSAIGGFADVPALLGVAGVVMVAGNVYATVRA